MSEHVTDPFDTEEFAKFRHSVIADFEKKFLPLYKPLMIEIAKDSIKTLKVMLDDEKKNEKKGTTVTYKRKKTKEQQK